MEYLFEANANRIMAEQDRGDLAKEFLVSDRKPFSIFPKTLNFFRCHTFQ